MLLPCGMGEPSGFFLGTWSWTGSWSWFVHAENSLDGSEALLHINTEWHEEILRRDNRVFSSIVKNTCNTGLERMSGLQ